MGMLSHATVQALIDAQAQARPDAVYALAVDSGATLSFGQLARDTRSVAAWLRAHGSAPGDVVSLVMPNGLQTLRILLGAMAGGWCVNPVNLLAQPEQMRFVLAHSDCRVVFTTPEREADVRAIVATLGREVAVAVTAADPSINIALLEAKLRPLTLDEVGQKFNLTRERIRQIEAKALTKLRHPCSPGHTRHLSTMG